MKSVYRLSHASIVLTAALGVGGYALAGSPTSDPWLGTPVQADQADRVIKIDAGTRWVNVEPRETVKFVVRPTSGKEGSFVWRFDGARGVIDLDRIAPSGLLPKPIKAYVAAERGDS